MIVFDEKKIKSAQKFLSAFPEGMGKVVVKSLNDAIRAARTAGNKTARETYFAKARDINKTIEIKRATQSKLEARLESKSGSAYLSKFQIKPKKPQRLGRGRYLHARVRKDASGGLLKKSFWARMKSGHTGIFVKTKEISKRTGRLKIKELYGPSFTSMLKEENVLKAMEERAEEYFVARVDHYTDRFLKGEIR